MNINIQSLYGAEEAWVVSDIRLSGLQRVSAGSVFAEMPITIGDDIDVYDLQIVAKTLFKTGQFDDVQIGRDGNILIISLVERPSISSIEIEGNKALKTEDLMKGLEGEADSNKDRRITNGELLVYLDQNISQKALELGRQQNPSLSGDPNKVLISLR